MSSPKTSRFLHGAWLAFVIASLFYLFEFVARVEPSLASGEIAKFLGLSNAGFGGVSSLFFWVYAPMQLVVGLLLDRHGARRLLVPAIAVCAFGVLLFALSDSPLIAGAGRAMTGFGAAFAFVGALYVVNHRFAPERFAILSGLVNAIGMLGTAIGAVALSAAMEASGWRDVFLATGGAGFGLFVLAFFFFRDGAASGADNTDGDGLLGPLAAVVSDRRVWMIAVLGALYYMPVNVFGGLWGQEEMRLDHGLSAVQAETAVSMIFWGMAAGSVASGALSDWIGHRKWLVVGGALAAAAAYGAAIYGTAGTVASISILLFLGGFFGGAQMLTFAMAKEGLPISVAGAVIAFVNMISIGGALIFQPLIGYLVDLEGGDFAGALLSIPLCLVAAALIALFVGEMRHEDHVS